MVPDAPPMSRLGTAACGLRCPRKAHGNDYLFPMPAPGWPTRRRPWHRGAPMRRAAHRNRTSASLQGPAPLCAVKLALQQVVSRKVYRCIRSNADKRGSQAFVERRNALSPKNRRNGIEHSCVCHQTRRPLTCERANNNSSTPQTENQASRNRQVAPTAQTTKRCQ
jgi:hypothetical protein